MKNVKDVNIGKSLVYMVEICLQLMCVSMKYIVSFKDVFGITMDEIASKHDELGECSYCGVFRRVCLNKKSKDLRLDKLVTGHNLDDIAQSILMNFVNGDMQKLARLGPHRKVQPGLVPRMLPLRTIPEKEVALYAIIKNTESFI